MLGINTISINTISINTISPISIDKSTLIFSEDINVLSGPIISLN